MKVRDLITKLQSQNQDAQVFFDNGTLHGMRILPSIDDIAAETVVLFRKDDAIQTRCVLLKRLFDSDGNKVQE